MAEDTEKSVHDSTEWTRAVDRGKLIHVNDIVFSVFVEMVLVLRKNLKSSQQSLHEVVEVIVKDENVFFAWAIVSASWQQEDSAILNCRGYSNAKSLLECTSTSHTRVFKNEKDYVESFQPTELEVFCCSFYFDE